jgi:hypothetical protein
MGGKGESNGSMGRQSAAGKGKTCGKGQEGGQIGTLTFEISLRNFALLNHMLGLPRFA